MSRNYSNKHQVACDIVKCWQDYAIDSLFEVMSFNNNDEITQISLGGENHSARITLVKEINKININISVFQYDNNAYVRAREQRLANRARNRRGLMGMMNNVNEGYINNEIINCDLKDLRSKITKENSMYIIELSKLILEGYNQHLESKEEVIKLIEGTKSMSRRKVSREFIVEKM